MVTFPPDLRTSDQPMRLLMIEDDRLTARLVENHLQKGFPQGFSLEHTTSLTEGLTRIEEKNFDALLLDLNLPDSSGLETIEAVKRQNRNLPIIIMTANDCDESSINAIRMGAQDYLVKGSFNYRLLCRTIMHAIERHRLLRVIQRLSVLDELTGVYNRRGFNNLCENLLAENAGGSRFINVFCFDLDRFKQLNDTYGHATGDEALILFTEALQKVFYADEIIGRLGGDEFAVVMDTPSPEENLQKIAYLKAWLHELSQEKKTPFKLEFSAGHITHPLGEKLNIASLLALADEALYIEKKEKRQETNPASSI